VRPGALRRGAHDTRGPRCANTDVDARRSGGGTPTMALRKELKEFMECRPDGHVAEWLRRGLQNLLPRFNSGRGLHSQYQQLNRGLKRGARRLGVTGSDVSRCAPLPPARQMSPRSARPACARSGLNDAARPVPVVGAIVRDLGTVARIGVALRFDFPASPAGRHPCIRSAVMQHARSGFLHEGVHHGGHRRHFGGGPRVCSGASLPASSPVQFRATGRRAL
jgi:hypothetical protein